MTNTILLLGVDGIVISEHQKRWPQVPVTDTVLMVVVITVSKVVNKYVFQMKKNQVNGIFSRRHVNMTASITMKVTSIVMMIVKLVVKD